MAFNNTSANYSCDAVDQVSSSLAVGIAVAHILLVVVPSLPLGVTLLLMLKTVERDQVTTLFACTTVVCMVGPWTHGLLMDISLITDKPVIGQCGTLSSETYWVLHIGLQYCLSMCASLISVTQYLIVRRTSRSRSSQSGYKRSLVAFFTAVAIAAVLIIPYLALGGWTCNFRGSLCSESVEDVSYGMLLLLLEFVGLFVVISTVVVASFLTYNVVRRGLIEGSGGIKSVLAVVSSMTVATVIFRAAPYGGAYFLGYYSAKTRLYTHAIDTSGDFNYLLYMLLMLFIHKKLRNNLKEKASHIWYTYIKRETRVVRIHLTQE